MGRAGKCARHAANTRSVVCLPQRKYNVCLEPWIQTTIGRAGIARQGRHRCATPRASRVLRRRPLPPAVCGPPPRRERARASRQRPALRSHPPLAGTEGIKERAAAVDHPSQPHTPFAIFQRYMRANAIIVPMPKMALTWPKSANFGPSSIQLFEIRAQIRPIPARTRPTFPRIVTSSPVVNRTLANVVHNSMHSDQIWAQLGPSSPSLIDFGESGRHSPKLARSRVRPKFGPPRPKSDRFRPSLADAGRNRPEFGRCRPNAVAPLGSRFAGCP